MKKKVMMENVIRVFDAFKVGLPCSVNRAEEKFVRAQCV